MKSPDLASQLQKRPNVSLTRIGCVSYINAKPLIHGVAEQQWADVRFAVPSELLGDLEAGETHIALCPVVDYFRSEHDLAIVPAGAIGCEGPTLTVRLFSRVPLGEISAVHADSDSHTSVALLRIIMARHLKRDARIVDYKAADFDQQARLRDQPEAVLLIGDKVINAEPDPDVYPHQLDLGEAWHDMTSLPFVFAVWMAQSSAKLGDAPAKLEAIRKTNAASIKAIADQYAHAHGWSNELAEAYLGSMLKYEIEQPQFDAIKLFSEYAYELGLIPQPKAIRLFAAD